MKILNSFCRNGERWVIVIEDPQLIPREEELTSVLDLVFISYCWKHISSSYLKSSDIFNSAQYWLSVYCLVVRKTLVTRYQSINPA